MLVFNLALEVQNSDICEKIVTVLIKVTLLIAINDKDFPKVVYLLKAFTQT